MTTPPAQQSESANKITQNSPTKVAIASLVGTAVEFYDFYIYGLAAALVLSDLFYPKILMKHK